MISLLCSAIYFQFFFDCLRSDFGKVGKYVSEKQ